MISKLLTRLSPLAFFAVSATAAFAEEGVQTAGGKADEPGLLDVKFGSVAWVLIIFVIVVIILYRTAWKNVLVGLKGREERIRKDMAIAEEARAKGEATLKDYNAQLSNAEARAREILGKAVTDAQAAADRIKVEAENAAQERSERAARDIQEARDQALREIYEQAAELSTNIAEKILRRNLNPNDQRDLVAQSVEQMSAVNRG